MGDKKVSVVLTVYNGEKYLHRSIESIISQTLSDLEIICVNDGSTDGTAKILEEYSAKDNRLKIINIKNSGAGAARNAGLERADGKYIAFLDADDSFEKNFLADMYNAAEENGAQVTVCRCRGVDADGTISDMSWAVQTKYLPAKNLFSCTEVNDSLFVMFRGWAWDKLFLKDFILKENILFQEQKTSNDAFFVYAALSRAERIFFLDSVLVNYTINTSGSVSRSRDNNMGDGVNLILCLKKYLEDNNTFEKYKKAYANWAADYIVWYYTSLAESSRGTMLKLISSEIEPEAGLCRLPYSYYFDEHQYLRYLVLANSPDYRTADWAMEEIRRGEEKEALSINLSAECGKLTAERDSLDGKLIRAEEEIENIRKSFSYRLGRWLTAIPRKLFKKNKKD